LSPNRISRWLGALALGAALAGCAATPTAPVKATPAPAASVTSSTAAAPTTATTTTTTTTTATPPAPVTTAVQQAPPQQHAAPPPRTTTSHKSASCSGGYINVDGNCVPRPTHADSPPAGATAHCKDGTYSFSQHRQGTCSGHGGVAQWL
jgi:hypothetical protein